MGKKNKQLKIKFKEQELFWLQAVAAQRGRSLEGMMREGLSIVMALPDDLLDQAFEAGLDQGLYLGQYIENALLKSLGMPEKNKADDARIKDSREVLALKKRLKAEQEKRRERQADHAE